MISDSYPEEEVYPISIQQRGYYLDVRYECPACHTITKLSLLDADKYLLTNCPGCGELIKIILEGDGE